MKLMVIIEGNDDKWSHNVIAFNFSACHRTCFINLKVMDDCYAFWKVYIYIIWELNE